MGIVAMRETLSRRQMLLGTGAATATAIGGIALTTQETSATTASVSGNYSVSDGETVLADQQLEKIMLSVDANWSFTSNANIHTVETELLVGATTDTLDVIAREEKTDLSKKELTGNPTLSGSLTNASDYDIEDFTPSSGDLSMSVVSALRFYVLRDGEVVENAEQTTTFTVTVSEEELKVSVEVGGVGGVSFETA